MAKVIANTQIDEAQANAYPLVWRIRTRLPWMHGQPCRVIVRARTMNSALVEFSCGQASVDEHDA